MRNKPITKIYLLHYPKVSHGEIAIKFPTRKVLALFVYLLVEESAQPREKLITLFWSQSDIEAASASLRSSLSRLRSALAPTNIQIKTDNYTVQLIHSDVILDVSLLNTLFHSVSGQNQIGTGSLDYLTESLARFEYDFLDTFTVDDASEFEQWVLYHRHEYRKKLNLVYESVINALITNQNLPHAETYARQWLQGDFLLEEAHHLLIRILWLSGNQVAIRTAIKHYQQMADELGIEANESILKLERLPEVVSHQEQPSAQIPFVGRFQDLQTLKLCLETAENGHSHTACIIGESGIGKTRLVTEFLHLAGVYDWSILSGRAFEYGASFPYQPLIDALREQVDKENAPEDLLNDIWLSELSRIIPELRDRYPDLSPYTNETDLIKPRLFEAILRLTIALSERQPLILFIDDVQWADPSSLELLLYLTHHWQVRQTCILLILTLRIENLDSQPNIAKWLQSMTRASKVRQIRLALLTQNDIHQALDTLTTVEHQTDIQHQDISAWMFDKTQGNAFFLSEIITWFQDNQSTEIIDAVIDGGVKEGNWGYLGLSVTQEIYTTIANRIEYLTDSERNILLAIAVFQRVCTFNELSVIAQLDEEIALNAIDNLLSLHLLQTVSDRIDSYMMSHSMLREVIYAIGGKTRQSIYHRRILNHLESDLSYGEVAYHALQSNELNKAFIYHLKAGDAALAIFAVGEADYNFQQAFQLLESVANQVSIEDLDNLFVCRGRTFEYRGQYNDALENYQEMATLASTYNHPTMLIKAQIREATLYSTLTPVSNPSKGQDMSEQTLEQSRLDNNPSAEVESLWNLINAHRLMGDLSQAIIYGEHALEQVQKLDDDRLLGFILNDLCNAYAAQGRLSQAVEAASQAQIIWRRIGNRAMLTDALGAASNCSAFLGEFEQAIAYGEEGFRIGQEIDNIWAQTYCRSSVAKAYWFLGDYQQALNILEEVVTQGDLTDLPIARVYGRDFLAQAHDVFGDFEKGLQVSQIALQSSIEQVPGLSAQVLPTVALLHLKLGDVESAERVLSTLSIDVHSVWIPFDRFKRIEAEARILVQRGRLDEAIEILQAFLTEHQQTELYPNYAETLITLAELQKAYGDIAYQDTLALVRPLLEKLESQYLNNLIQALLESE